MVDYAMNSTNISGGSDSAVTDPRSDAAVVLQSASMTILIIAAVGGNLLILAAIYIDKTLQTLTNAFIVNLACADFLLASLGMPFTLVSSITYEWIFGSAWCTINGMANSLFCIASILTLGAVSVDRYVAILHPFRYSLWMTRKTVTAMITYIWFHSFAIAILPAAGWSSYTFLKMESICTVRWDDNLAFTLFLFTVCFFIPLAVIMFTYYKIFQTASKQAKRIVPITGQITSPSEPEDDEEISSVEQVSTHRVGRGKSLASINSEAEHTKRSGARTRYALEVNRKVDGFNDYEMTDSNPASKDSGFEECNNSSSMMPSMFIAQTPDLFKGPGDALLQRNASDSAFVLALDRTLQDTSPTSSHIEMKPSQPYQGSTEKTTPQSESESRNHRKKSADCWRLKVPTQYVESTAGDSSSSGTESVMTTSKRADSCKNPNDSSPHSAKDHSSRNIGSLSKILQCKVQQRSSASLVCDEGAGTESRLSQDEQFSYDADNEKETRNRHRLVMKRNGGTAAGNVAAGPIPMTVPSSHGKLLHESQGEPSERSGDKRGCNVGLAGSAGGIFSVSRDARGLLNRPALATVLGQKSTALLRRRRKSSEYRSKMKRDRKAAKTIVIVLGTFILLWSPHFVGIFCLLIDGCNWPDEFYALTTWMAMLNSACNPIIYGVMSRQFRKRFFQILRCKRGFF